MITNTPQRHSRKLNNKLNRSHKKGLYALCTMMNAQPFISCPREANQWQFILGIFNTSRQKFLNLKLEYRLLL